MDFNEQLDIASYELSTGYALRVRAQDEGREYVDIHGDDGTTAPVLLSMSWADFRGMARHFAEVAGETPSEGIARVIANSPIVNTYAEKRDEKWHVTLTILDGRMVMDDIKRIAHGEIRSRRTREGHSSRFITRFKEAMPRNDGSTEWNFYG